jgi:copper(I)-binding protein
MPISLTRCLAMLAAIVCVVQASLASDIMVMNAVARASLTPTATSAALYFSIMNHGGSDDALLSLSTPAALAATLHETKNLNDVVSMRERTEPLIISAGTTYDLKPGGTHVMLTGLHAPLKQGAVLVLDLVFAKSGKLQVKVPVGNAAAAHDHPE